MMKSVKRASNVLSASRVASLALLALCGCGSSAVRATPTPNTNDPADTPDTSDPGTENPTPTTTTTGPTLDLPGAATQLANGLIKLIGVTTDEQLIYTTTTTVGSTLATLSTVPLAGGAPTVLVQSFDTDTSMAVVSGGAVGIWTQISSHRGTFNLWTRSGGLKSNLTNLHDSAAGVFAATTDGTRVAFSVGAISSSETNLAIATSSSVGLTTIGILDAESLIDTAASRDTDPTCAPAIRFTATSSLIAAYCVGTSSAASLARLYWVAAGGTSPVRLDNVGSAIGSIKPTWFSDTNGTKIYAVSADGNSQARIVTPPVNGQAATSVALDVDAANAGFITNDGQTVVYRTPELGLRRASTSANPAPQTLVPGIRTILDISSDLTKVLVHSLGTTGGLDDIRAADIVTANQTPHDIVATATARPLGFTGDSQFVLYLDQISGSSNHLEAQAAMGGAVKSLAQNVTDVVFPDGSPGGVTQTADGQTPEGAPTYTITYVNASSGHASPVLATQVPGTVSGGLLWMNHKLVWVTQATSNPGVFVAPIP